MKHLIIAAIALAFLQSNETMSAEYVQQSVHYTIRVRLDTAGHMLTGTEQITYTNNSPDTLHTFYLHLYPNAFESKDTALMKDYLRHFNVSFINLPKKYRSYLKLHDVTIDGTDVSVKVDDTIAEIALPLPLPPGASMDVSLRFEEKIPRHIGRTGYRGDQYDVAQWYPKVVVYDENGFHPDKYRRGEFYGEFGNFDVYIDVPERYVIAATGELRDGDPGWSLNRPDSRDGKSGRSKDDSFKTVHFHAANVHDFAWNASPDFVVQDSTWNGIDIRSFYKKGNRAWADSTLIHGVRAIEWLSERVGMYPYPQISIVQGLLRGGMEYPMLAMNGHVSETLVLHEVGHSYFYGILANNERAEAWLDEGLTTFQTGWYLTERYGEYGNTERWNWYQRITPQYTVAERQRRWVLPLLREGYGGDRRRITDDA